jgi:hypothetical protein
MDLFPTQESYPFDNQGPSDFFPPVCNEFHFDPTQIIKHQLPQENYSVPLPLDPRPWTRICMEYRNTTSNEEAPSTDPNIVFPAGGFFQDPNKYLASVDSESSLRRLDQPLRKCDTGKFEVNQQGDMFNSRLLVPHNQTPMSQFSDLEFPKVLLNVGPYDCRAQADAINVGASQKPFFNATKQDRYYKSDGAPRNLNTNTTFR